MLSLGVKVTASLWPVPAPKTVPAAVVKVKVPATVTGLPPTVQVAVPLSWLLESAVP